MSQKYIAFEKEISCIFKIFFLMFLRHLMFTYRSEASKRHASETPLRVYDIGRGKIPPGHKPIKNIHSNFAQESFGG